MDGADMDMVTVMDGEDITIRGMAEDILDMPITVITAIEITRTIGEDVDITITV